MIVFWALIATFQILTTHAGNACKSGKYEIMEESSNGYCFFLLPKSDYQNLLYKKQPDGKYRLLDENADRICERHQASLLTGNFLQQMELPFDPQPQIQAAQKLRERSGKTIFVGCGRRGKGNLTFENIDWRCEIGGKKPALEEFLVSYTNASAAVYSTRNRIWSADELPALACYQYHTALETVAPKQTPATQPQEAIRTKPKIGDTTTTTKPTSAIIAPHKPTIRPKPTKPTPKPPPRPGAVENACKSGKYKLFKESSNGYCFFVLPESEYRETMYEKLPDGTYRSLYGKADEICRRHNAFVLTGNFLLRDWQRPPPQVVAARTLQERFEKEFFVGCELNRRPVSPFDNNVWRCNNGKKQPDPKAEYSTGRTWKADELPALACYQYHPPLATAFPKQTPATQPQEAIITKPKISDTTTTTKPTSAITAPHKTPPKRTKPTPKGQPTPGPVENACKSGKYSISEESSNGFCFFVLPESEYVHTMYEELPDGRYRLLYEKAYEICERHHALLLPAGLLRGNPPLPPKKVSALNIHRRFGRILFTGCWDTIIGLAKPVLCDKGATSDTKNLMLSYAKPEQIFSTPNRIWNGSELPGLACYQVPTVLVTIPRKPEPSTTTTRRSEAVITTPEAPTNTTRTDEKTAATERQTPNGPIANACKSGKYVTTQESSNGYCFFVLPESEYVYTMYEKLPEGKYRLLYDKTHEICERHQATLLSGDLFQPNSPAYVPLTQKLPGRKNMTLIRKFGRILFGGCAERTRTGLNYRRCDIDEKQLDSKHVMLSYIKPGSVFLSTKRIWNGSELPGLACYQYQKPPTTISLKPTTTTTPKPTTTTKKSTRTSTSSKVTTTPPKPTTTTKHRPDTEPAQTENACKSNKYENFEAFRGFCFFEPPKIEYEKVINEETEDPTKHHFNLDKAREICKKHKAQLLHWDISKDNVVTKAVIKLRQKLDLDVPVDCFVEQDTRKVNCNKGPAAANATHFAFISHEDRFYTWSQRLYYEKYWSGLICEMRPIWLE